MSFLSGLALLFVGLKLGHVIDWSWFFVVLPLLLAWFPRVFMWGVSVAAKTRGKQ